MSKDVGTTKVYVFTSSTCAPCEQIKPALKELQEDFPLEWIFVSLDSVEAKKYDIQKVPTMVVDSPKGIKKHSGTDIIGYYKILTT
jgi:thiol-disulfide isomerase/thioredoxin